MPNQTNTQASLIYNANKGSSFEHNKRDYRYGHRAQAWMVSNHDRFKKCGRTSIGPVTLGLKGGVAQQRGLYTCGSVWVCPVCNAKVMTKRGQEIENALAAWANQGGFFVFETLTLSHRPGDSVAKQRSVAKKAWEATTKGSFKAKHARFGQQGYFRIVEVTTGADGEHLHFHVMRFIDHWLTSDELTTWREAIFTKWADAAESQGAVRPQAKYHDFQQIAAAGDLGGYFTKNYDNPKSASTALLTGSNEDTSIWRLLDGAIADPKSQSANRWRAYERDTLGMKQISWSSGFRKELGLGLEVSDEDLATEKDVFEPIVQIDPLSVRKLGNLGRIHSRILRHLELGDLETSLHLLAEHGISFTLFRTMTNNDPWDTA